MENALFVCEHGHRILRCVGYEIKVVRRMPWVGRRKIGENPCEPKMFMKIQLVRRTSWPISHSELKLNVHNQKDLSSHDESERAPKKILKMKDDPKMYMKTKDGVRHMSYQAAEKRISTVLLRPCFVGPKDLHGSLLLRIHADSSPQ